MAPQQLHFRFFIQVMEVWGLTQEPHSKAPGGALELCLLLGVIAQSEACTENTLSRVLIRTNSFCPIFWSILRNYPQPYALGLLRPPGSAGDQNLGLLLSKHAFGSLPLTSDFWAPQA